MADKYKGIRVQIGGDTTGLSKALASVNKQISDTQKELKQVERLLKLDPTNTKLLEQKQRLLSDAIGETKTKLDALKQANEKAAASAKNYDAWKAKYDPIQTEIDQTLKKLEKLRDAQKDLEESGKIDTDEYRKLQSEAEESTKRLKELKAQAKAVSEEFGNPLSPEMMDSLQRELIESQQELDRLEKKARQFGSVFSQQMQVTGGKISEFGDKVSGVGQKLLPITGAVAGIGAAAVKTSADFDSAMSKVQSLSGASGKELERLRDAALEMGETTAFSATEAADALGYMALAGWDAEQSTTALPAVLNLAAASGMDLAQASDMVTDYLSAFGLKAADAAYFSDLLAYAQANSNTSAEQLGEAYKNCAANLNAAGQDVETVTSMLEAMANQGLKGSEAGTALNAIMRDITAQMDEGAIKIGDTSVAVQDADGNFRDLTAILSDVQAATEGMGTAQQAAALSTTFTADSTKGLNLLFNEGMEAVSGYEESLRGGLGTASQQAETMLDNLNGQLTLLKSALEGAAISIGETLAPMVSQLVGYVQQAVDWFNAMDDGQKRMAVTIGLVAAAIGPLLMLLGNVISTIGIITTGVGALSGFIIGTVVPAITGSLSGLFAFLMANPVLAIIAGITAAIVVLVARIATKGDEIQAILQSVDNFLQGIFATNWSNVFGPVLGGILNAFFANLKNIWNSIKQVFDGVIDFIRGIFTGNWERAWNGVRDIFSGIFGGLEARAKPPINGIIGLVNSAIGGINGLIDAVNKLPFANIGKIGTIPFLAKGGVLSNGSAVVGEAGPELLTVSGGKGIVQPLTNQTNKTNNFGATNIYVYGSSGQDPRELARYVMEEIRFEQQRKEAQFA